jgi:prophage tail gpP-like protein
MPASIDTTQEPELLVFWQGLGDDRIPRVLKSWSVDSDFFTATDGWEAAYYDEDPFRLLGLELTAIEMALGESSILIGRVDSSTISGTGKVVTLRGRDYIADLTECNIDPSFKIQKDESLGNVVKRACAPLGVTNVISDGGETVRNARTGASIGNGIPKTFTELRLSDFKPEPGQGVYDFCNKLVARHGTTIQPTTSRDALSLQAPNYDQTPSGSIVRSSSSAAANRNILISASATRDFSSFPTYTLFTGRQSVDGGGTEDKRSFADIEDYITAAGITSLQTELAGKVADGRILPEKSNRGGDSRLYRLMYFRDEQARNQEQLDRSASRAIGERLKDTLVYEVTVWGHRDPNTGTYWAPDTIVSVNDDVTGVQEDLWVASRRFEYSPESGATTTMRMWRPGAITL